MRQGHCLCRQRLWTQGQTPFTISHRPTHWEWSVFPQKWNERRGEPEWSGQGFPSISEWRLPPPPPRHLQPRGGFDHLQTCSVTGSRPEVSTFYRREDNEPLGILIHRGSPRAVGANRLSLWGVASDGSRCYRLEDCVVPESFKPLQIHILSCQIGQDSLSFIWAK